MKTNKNLNWGESAVIVGKCLHFLPSEIALSDDFIWYLKQGAMVHSSLAMCCTWCVNSGFSPARSSTFHPAHAHSISASVLRQWARGTADSDFQHNSHHSSVFCWSNTVASVVLSREPLLTLGTGNSPRAKKESVFSRENMSGKIKNTFYLCFRFLKRLF